MSRNFKSQSTEIIFDQKVVETYKGGKIIKYLFEMSTIRDAVALDLNRVAFRLNGLKVAMRENIDQDKLADFIDQYSSRNY